MLKIDARLRPLTPRDEELITAIESDNPFFAGEYELSEVALVYVAEGRKAEPGLEMTFTVREADGGFSDITYIVGSSHPKFTTHPYSIPNSERVPTP